jgi:hypothetical protein
MQFTKGSVMAGGIIHQAKQLCTEWGDRKPAVWRICNLNIPSLMAAGNEDRPALYPQVPLNKPRKGEEIKMREAPPQMTNDN